MKKIKPNVLSGLLLVIMALFLAQPAYAKLDKLIAIVGQEAITQYDFDQMKAALFQMEPRLQEEYARVDEKEQKNLDDQLFHDLLMKHLVLQQAKAHQIDIDDADYQRAIEQMAAANKMTVSQLYDQVTAQGLDLATFKKHIREQVHLEKYFHVALAGDLFVSDQDVQDFIKQASAEMSRYRLNDFWVTSKDDEAKQLMASVSKALTQSQGLLPESALFDSVQHESLGERVLSQIPQVYHPFLTSLQVGQASPAIHAANGYHVIYLEESTHLDEGSARNQLLNQKFMKKKQAMLEAMESMAFIKDMRDS